LALFNKLGRSAHKTAAARDALWLMVFLLTVPIPAHASPCLAPDRPFLPSDARAVLDFADILRRDFDVYIADI
jgi:hypothetical protein